MDRLAPHLSRARSPEAEWRPRLYRLPDDRDALSDLFEEDLRIEVFDRIEAQIGELLATRHPGRRLPPEELSAMVREHVERAGKAPQTYGVWVYYPWSHRLVHLLDEPEFVELRTSRNRDKITQEEQSRLAGSRVGVVGLSVGQSAALAVALERSCGELRLADFDDVGLSNLNRIRTGVHNLGAQKVVVTAREIAEIDPFLRVVCLKEGLTGDTIERFFHEGGKLDLCLEECDSLAMKVEVRHKARAERVPVLMETSDRGMLDVERFDLEPDRPILHGRVGDVTPAEVAGMSREEAFAFVMKIVGEDTVSPRMRASLAQVGRTLCTWPQLASSVVLGGGLIADVARRVLLGEEVPSGRYFADVDELLAGGSRA